MSYGEVRERDYISSSRGEKNTFGREGALWGSGMKLTKLEDQRDE